MLKYLKIGRHKLACEVLVGTRVQPQVLLLKQAGVHWPASPRDSPISPVQPRDYKRVPPYPFFFLIYRLQGPNATLKSSSTLLTESSSSPKPRIFLFSWQTTFYGMKKLMKISRSFQLPL